MNEKPSTETMMQYCSQQYQKLPDELPDLRVVVAYRTVANDYMVVLYLYAKYRLYFVDQNYAGHKITNMINASNDISAKEQSAHIAKMIGATLIEEAQG